MTLLEKVWDKSELDCLPNITETALAVIDGDPDVLLDAVVFYLHHRPDRWREVADFHFKRNDD